MVSRAQQFVSRRTSVIFDSRERYFVQVATRKSGGEGRRITVTRRNGKKLGSKCNNSGNDNRDVDVARHRRHRVSKVPLSRPYVRTTSLALRRVTHPIPARCAGLSHYLSVTLYVCVCKCVPFPVQPFSRIARPFSRFLAVRVPRRCVARALSRSRSSATERFQECDSARPRGRFARRTSFRER